MIEAHLAKGDFPDPRYNRARWYYRCTECQCSVDQTRILKPFKRCMAITTGLPDASLTTQRRNTVARCKFGTEKGGASNEREV